MSYAAKIQLELAYKSGFSDGYGGIEKVNPFSKEDKDQQDFRYTMYEQGYAKGKSCRFDYEGEDANSDSLHR
jgi:hypothetical protein